jgi:hypothetical protein
MAECKECGKKLRPFEGYHHPRIRKEWLFCSKCYDKLAVKSFKKKELK